MHQALNDGKENVMAQSGLGKGWCENLNRRMSLECSRMVEKNQYDCNILRKTTRKVVREGTRSEPR